MSFWYSCITIVTMNTFSSISSIISNFPEYSKGLTENSSESDIVDTIINTPMTDHSGPFLHALSTMVTKESNTEIVFHKHPCLSWSLAKNKNLSGQWLADQYDKDDYDTYCFLKHPNFPMDMLLDISHSGPGRYGENHVAIISYNPNLSIKVMESLSSNPSKAVLHGLLKNPSTPHVILMKMVDTTYEWNPEFILDFTMHPHYDKEVANKILTKFHGSLDESTTNILLDSFTP